MPEADRAQAEAGARAEARARAEGEPRRFRAYGLVFDSALPLPGAAPVPDDMPADVALRLGPVRPEGRAAAPAAGPAGDGAASPDASPLAAPAEAPAAPGAWRVRGPGLAEGEWDGARLRVEDGVRVTVDIAGDMAGYAAGDMAADAATDAGGAAPRPAAAAALIASAACMLLHQRGTPPMHAAAAAGSDGAALLIGGPGAGKSTFAALLAAGGMALGADDLAALDLSGPTPRVHAAPRAAKLFADSQAALLAAAPGGRALSRAGDGQGKALLAPPAPGPAGDPDWPAPLRAVVALEWLHPPDAPPELERLGGAEALARLRAAVGRPELIAPLGAEARCFARLARLAAAVPVFALRRPRRYEASGAAAALVRAALAEEAARLRGETS